MRRTCSSCLRLTIRSQSSNSRRTFGERVRLRRPKRGADDLHGLAAENLVEGAAELAVSVVDQEADRCDTLRERPGELARLLDCPPPIRVRRAADEVDAASADLKEEEHVLRRVGAAVGEKRGFRTRDRCR